MTFYSYYFLPFKMISHNLSTVCKGGNIRLVKRFDSDWAIFAENDSATDYIKVGTSKKRPTYQDCDAMLSAMGISVKYARDIGLAPKFEGKE
jgi:hypothetical protein